MLVSGLAWLAADAVWYIWGGFYAFVAIFIGGMLLFPLSLLIARLFRAPRAAKENPLKLLGLEVSFPLFAGLLIAFGLLPISEPFAFAALALVVGTRYFAFATLYDERLYWLLGGAIFLVATAFAIKSDLVPVHVTLVVGSIELILGAWLFTRWNATRSEAQPAPLPA